MKKFRWKALFQKKEPPMQNETVAIYPQSEATVDATLEALFGGSETPAEELPNEEPALSIEIKVRGKD